MTTQTHSSPFPLDIKTTSPTLPGVAAHLHLFISNQSTTSHLKRANLFPLSRWGPGGEFCIITPFLGQMAVKAVGAGGGVPRPILWNSPPFSVKKYYGWRHISGLVSDLLPSLIYKYVSNGIVPRFMVNSTHLVWYSIAIRWANLSKHIQSFSVKIYRMLLGVRLFRCVFSK